MLASVWQLEVDCQVDGEYLVSRLHSLKLDNDNTHLFLFLLYKNPESGVCAKVRIQILQKITLTRTGFKAELILENGETSDLTNIAVNISIVSYDTNTDSLNKFAIGLIISQFLTNISI